MSDPITTILLIRHADVHNPGDVVYGRLPRFGLSAVGHTEAARTAAALAGEPLAALYSSPQLRARQTAAAIAAHHPSLAMQVTSRLAEVRTGWQGTGNEEMARRQFNFYDPLHSPGDESLEDLSIRLLRWISALLVRYAGQTVAGVSHGDPVMVGRLLFSGTPLTLVTLRDRSRYPPKGSITRLVFSGQGDPHRLPVTVSDSDPSAATRPSLDEDAAAPWAARSYAEVAT